MARLFRTLLVGSLLAHSICGGSPAFAAEDLGLAPLARVRVTASRTDLDGGGAPRSFEGVLTQLDDSSLTIRPLGKAVAVVVPREAITRLDVRRHGSMRLTGLALGTAVGLVAGLILWEKSDADEGVVLAMYAVPAGALAGFVLAPGAKWDKRVPVHNVRVGLAPVRGRGVGLSVSVGF